MQTSYYAKYRGPHGVSIAGYAPKGYKGREYKKLAPKFWFFKKYKADGDEASYTENFQREVLDHLDPRQVYEELGPDAVLLCYEKSGAFCHRHLVARWLEKHLGITITEVE